jgi:hypothetical protein
LDTKAEVPEFAPALTILTTATNQQILAGAGYQLMEISTTNLALANSWLGRLTQGMAAKTQKRPRQSYRIATKSP